MFQNIAKNLTNIGLKEKDAKIYLACLHFKDGLFTHEIVEHTKIKRSTVDLAVSRL